MKKRIIAPAFAFLSLLLISPVSADIISNGVYPSNRTLPPVNIYDSVNPTLNTYAPYLIAFFCCISLVCWLIIFFLIMKMKKSNKNK